MTDYAAKEVRVFEKIEKEFAKLDETAQKWAATDNKVTAFVDQEKAIHEIKVIIRKAKKIERIEAEAADDALYEFAEASQDELDLLDEISGHFDRLDDALAKLDDTDNRAKSFIEQEKALHEVKKIVQKSAQL